MRQFQCVPTAYLLKITKKTIWKFIRPIVFTSFKHPKLPISIKIPVNLLQIVYICMAGIGVYELPLC